MRREVAFAALLGVSCVMRPPNVGEPPPSLADEAAEAEYARTLNAYSARAEIYSLFDTRAFLATTFQTPTFRKARARRLSEFRSETPAELDSRLVQEGEESDAAHEFFLGVHVNAPQHDDFDRRESMWRIALVSPAGEVLPLSVERVGRSSLPMRALYPYMDTFWVGYRVRFPREVAGQAVIPPGTRQVVLQVTSTLGRAELKVAAD